MKKYVLLGLSILLTFSLLLSACGKNNAQSTSGTNEKKELRIGFNAGPYIDEFKLGIVPYLEKKGYKITYKNFTDGVQPNVAVSKGEIDANIFQHSVYLKSINDKEKIDLVGVVQVPTPPMGIYSNKHKSLNDVKDGTTVAVPNDPVNMARALGILKDIGWIQIKEGVEPISVTLNSITSNLKNIKVVPMDSAQGPRALEDVDYVAIQGNFAVSSGKKLTEALQLENMTSPFINVVAVDKSNRDKQYVKDIIDAYHSKEFQQAIKTHEQFNGYKLPDYFK